MRKTLEDVLEEEIGNQEMGKGKYECKKKKKCKTALISHMLLEKLQGGGSDIITFSLSCKSNHRGFQQCDKI